MNTCPVYRRSGGLSYGATHSGPIGLILDPTLNRTKYSSLPFASTFNGSCANVCPVKINIHEQISAWRKVMAEEHRLPHLVVLLAREAIVPGLQDAYEHPCFRTAHYAVFHPGPSATADIEGVLIHDAQGVRALTVVLTR
jgi:L-lactate utilization protein LutB